MTQRVPDDVVAKFARQQHDWTERVLKGSLDPIEVAQAVQDIIDRGAKMFNPHTYFKDRQGLGVADSFTNRILPKVGPTPHRGNKGVTSSILARNMHDREIIDELLGGTREALRYSFTLDQIATMIDLQPNGEDGDLLNNGYANIFYVLVDEVPLAVLVHWHSDADDRKWYVHDWHLGVSGSWFAGARLFRNTTLVV